MGIINIYPYRLNKKHERRTNNMNEISTHDIEKMYKQMISKSMQRLDGHPTLMHIRCTREAYANLFAYKVKKICKEVGVKYSSVMCNEDVNTPTYLDVTTKINEINQTQYDGILFDTPFKQNQYIRNITSQIAQDKDIECFSELNYGKYLLGKPTPVIPCITASINDIVYLHGLGYEYKRVLIITDVDGDNYGLTMTNTFNSPTVTVVKPTDADYLATHFHEYDIIISLLFDSKICITKDTIPNKPNIEQLVFDYGWCSDTKDSTILTNIFDIDKVTYYDLANCLMDMYIYNAINNMLKYILSVNS